MNLTCPIKSWRLSTLSCVHFAGLSATGALTGGAAGIAKAVNDANAAKKQLEESQRHNQIIESIVLEKGLYLKPYKDGLGLPIDSEVYKKAKKLKKNPK